MATELLSYLSPENQNAVRSWTTEIGPIVDASPSLREVDLVIEGGVGTGSTMPEIARVLFPYATYVGTDLLSGKTKRQKEVLDERSLALITEVNTNPSNGLWRGTLDANCFDLKLIEDIKGKLGKTSAALVSFNALYSLLGKELSHFDKKGDADMRSINEVLSLKGPYHAQIHIGVDWDDDGRTVLSSPYLRLEREAQVIGWSAQRFDCGILLQHPSLIGT